MKKIFLTLLLIISSFNLFGQITYSGFIGKSPIIFYSAEESPHNNSSYSYTKFHEIIKLKGEAVVLNAMYTGKIVFYEKDNNGENTASLTFENFDTKKSQLEGTWTNLNSKKELKILIVKNKVRPISKKDALLIKKHLSKLRMESGGSDEEELNNFGRMRWNSGKVTYAPDGAFKIFIFEGESCGGNCNPSYDSFIQLKSGKIIKQDEDSSFETIDALFKTGANTYGTIEWSWGGGNSGGISYGLSQFSIINGRLKLLKTGSYGIFSHQSLSVSMKYNNVSKKIMFHYERMKYELFETDYMSDSDNELVKKIPKQLLPLNGDEILVVKGEFKAVNGKITDFKEWYEKEKEDFDEN